MNHRVPSQAMIRELQETSEARRVCVREAFERAGMTPGAPFVKNNTTTLRNKTACTRSIEECAFTVCAGHGLVRTQVENGCVHPSTHDC